MDSEEEKEEEVRTWYNQVTATGILGCVEQAGHVTCFRISEYFLKLKGQKVKCFLRVEISFCNLYREK